MVLIVTLCFAVFAFVLVIVCLGLLVCLFSLLLVFVFCLFLWSFVGRSVYVVTWLFSCC